MSRPSSYFLSSFFFFFSFFFHSSLFCQIPVEHTIYKSKLIDDNMTPWAPLGNEESSLEKYGGFDKVCKGGLNLNKRTKGVKEPKRKKALGSMLVIERKLESYVFRVLMWGSNLDRDSLG